ncbi:MULTISPECIES: glycosyl hydrolase family 28-related protein [unclassified Halomonas]|uniref:glycosyl hydrolase family 28-related protein n=1 Tax=unclassified Halomonas TaxID=2609666 RepID=UPI001C9408DD|nr:MULTISPECIES: glycosyl hydrolase family 28-related protein [unclassified Halomonas]MBY5926246.1 glycoside hydrolase family 55 protein [Halomonas sp. DP4Y7-2]MBY6233288.1 glycoside hydrolase family 55 protein [Halomonas sp. DP4Y7-1]
MATHHIDKLLSEGSPIIVRDTFRAPASARAVHAGTVEVGDIGSVSVTTPAGGVPRTLAERFHEYINVKDYGAVADGVTDDGPAIATAIEAAGIGQTVYFPCGVYLISAPLLINKVVSLKGDGSRSTELVFLQGGITLGTTTDTGRDTAVISELGFLAKSRGIHTGLTLVSHDQSGPKPPAFFLQNLKFHGFDTSSVGVNNYEWKTAIRMENADKSILSSVFIYGKERSSIDNYDTNTIGVDVRSSTGVVFSKVDVYRMKTGFSISGQSEGDNWVDGVVVAANVGIHFHDLITPSNNFSIRGGHYSCEQYGIWMEASQAVLHHMSKYNNISNCFFLQRRCDGSRANSSNGKAMKEYCALLMTTSYSTLSDVVMLSSLGDDFRPDLDQNCGIQLQGGECNILSNIVCIRSGISVDTMTSRDNVITNVVTEGVVDSAAMGSALAQGPGDVSLTRSEVNGWSLSSRNILFSVEAGPVLKLINGAGKDQAVNQLEVFSTDADKRWVGIRASSVDDAYPDQDIALLSSGAGHVRFGRFSPTSSAAVTGFIEIKDMSGRVRKLAVVEDVH